MKPVPLFFAAAIVVYGVVRRRGRSRIEWAALAVLLAGFLLYGLGLVEMPDFEQVVLDLGEKLGAWTYGLVGLMAFLETGAFVGLVAPGEFTILVGGVVAGQGRIEVFALIAIVWACAVAGDVTSYFLGRRLGRGFIERHGPRVKITHERIEQVERFFERHGGKAILIGRFVGLVRAIAPFLAGSSKMPLRKFIPYDVVGAGLWGSIFVLLGYVFWQSFDKVSEYAKKGALGLGVAIGLVFAIVLAVKYLREEEHRERLKAWAERQPLLRPLLPAARAARGPARFTWNRLTPGDLGLELTTLLMIAGIGLFTFFGYWHTLTLKRFTVGDLRALKVVDDLHTQWLVDASKVITTLGSLPVTGAVVAAAVLLLFFRSAIAEGLALAAAMGLTVWAVHLAKAAVDRPRPVHPLAGAADASYPSGHSAYAVAYVAVAVALARTVPGLVGRIGVVVGAVALVVLIGLTRMYLRVHFLSDVFGGYGLACGLFALCGIVALVVSHLRQNARTA